MLPLRPLALLLIMATPAPAAEAGLRLLMVERDGCGFCAAWNREVAPRYAASPEGRAAPLQRVPIDGPWPDGLALDRAPFVTPTFILVQGQNEVDRLEGYPGAQAFWPMLDAMIATTGTALPHRAAAR